MATVSRIPNAPYIVAYFSMEIAADPAMPTYSGGLGVLAGDALRAAADLGVSMVGVTLLHRKGYFRQHLDAQGNQTESPAKWTPEEYLEETPGRASVVIEGRTVFIRAWRYTVSGVNGHSVPVYFLDTDLSGNTPWDRALTDQLYGGDQYYRLCQEVVLGMGGVEILRSLGYQKVRAYHLNEGHSALLTLALLEQQTRDRGLATMTGADLEAVRQHCVFTTHTPVPAGQDQFPMAMVRQVMGNLYADTVIKAGCCWDGALNMTFLGLLLSRYINGVSMRHEEVSHSMFPNYPISSITNGVHALTWTSEPFKRLFARHVPQWRHDNLYLRYAISIPLDEVRQSHTEAKLELLDEVERRTRVRLDPAVMTIGFARRAAAYKRADLLFSDLDRLKRIARQVGPLQIIYAGKAHPRDENGKVMIRHIFEAASALKDTMRVIYLEEYDMTLARYVCSGVDLWLNTPQKPREASGTSGMKAALNGVPSLSVLDGWWIEGNVEGITGWSVGDSSQAESDPDRDSASLYEKLEYVIVPMFYKQPAAFSQVMRGAIALNGSYYNAQRMVFQYVENAYFASEPFQG